jgi:MFS family permease
MTETEVGTDAGAAPATKASQRGAFSSDAILSIYLPALILALGAGIALPSIPALAKSFDVSFGVASGVVTAFLIGNLAGAIPSGWLIDRYGRRAVLIAGPLLTAATALLVAFAQTFPELIVLRFINGFAAQMWLMARLTAISRRADAGQRGRQVAWMFGMDNSGKLTGPALGGFIAAQWGPQAPFIAYALLALLALAPTIRFGERRTRKDRAAREADRAAARAIPLWRLLTPRLAYFAIALFAGLTRGPIQADLLHLYAAFEYGLGPQAIGYLATAGAAVAWPIGFVAGWMLDRLGRRRTMIPGFVGVALAMAAMAVAAFTQMSLFLFVALFLLVLGCESITNGSVQTIGADVAPTEARGSFLGLWRFVGQSGSALSPIVFALLADQVNYGSSFLFVAASAAVVAALVARCVK